MEQGDARLVLYFVAPMAVMIILYTLIMVEMSHKTPTVQVLSTLSKSTLVVRNRTKNCSIILGKTESPAHDRSSYRSAQHRHSVDGKDRSKTGQFL